MPLKKKGEGGKNQVKAKQRQYCMFHISDTEEWKHQAFKLRFIFKWQKTTCRRNPPRVRWLEWDSNSDFSILFSRYLKPVKVSKVKWPVTQPFSSPVQIKENIHWWTSTPTLALFHSLQHILTSEPKHHLFMQNEVISTDISSPPMHSPTLSCEESETFIIWSCP